MSRNNVFAGGELDRVGPLRSDESWVAAHRANPQSRYVARSEEHTSELQSQAYLVCRLLLEKKKQQHK